MRRTREKTRKIKNNTTTATAEKRHRKKAFVNRNRMEARRERCNVDKNFSPQVLSRSPNFEQEISRL